MRLPVRPSLRHAARAVRGLARAQPHEWWLLLRSQKAIVEAMWLKRRRPQGELIRELTGFGAFGEPPHPADRDRVEETAVAIDRVARFGIGRPRCLVRSLALHRLLHRRRIPGSVVRVGVRRNGSSFEAHAWVEWDGVAVGERPARIRTFATFDELDPRWAANLRVSRTTSR